MNKFLLTVISLTVLFICGLSLAQEIYVYPNKRLADQGLIEYRRYTLEEARAYQQGGSFEPFLTTVWSGERQLTQQENVYGPKAITSGDSIFCTYFTLTPLEPYFIGSHDAGQSWSQTLFLGDTNSIRAYEYPELAKYGASLLIGCSIYDYNQHGYTLGYYKSLNGGISWDSLRIMFSSYRSNQSNFASTCNQGRNVFISYAEGDHDSIYVTRSWNFGVNWIGRGVNVAYLASTPQPMTIRASDSAIHLIWVNEVMPVSVRYSRSIDSGRIWVPEIDIANDSLGSQSCCVSVQGQHVVASWMGYKYSPHMFTGDMFIRQSFDGGVTWDTAQVLTESHYVWMGSNYIKDSLVVIAWQDDRYGGNNNEAMARYSTNYGQTWSEETRLSYGDFDSHSPIACVTGNRIHVLWGDGRPEAPGLYYSNNDLYMDIDESELPTEHTLLSAYPNPFNSSIIIDCSKTDGKNIMIYNIAGQLVKTININGKEAKTTWDGKDDSGQTLSSGIYLAVVNTSLGMQHIKVTYLK